jgi:alpha-1,2-mannosyltransferase
VTGVFQSPLLRRAVAVCVIALAAFTIVVRAAEYGTVDRFSKDFALDYASAKEVAAGGDAYAPIQTLVGRWLDPPPEVLANHVLPGANWHPPFKLVVTLPLTVLPYQAAGIVWLLISVACFGAAAFVFARELGSGRRVALLCGAGILILPIVQTDLSAGQLNGPMLLLIVLAWRALRRDTALAAGAALGVLVALKLFPGFLALPLLGARRYRMVGLAVVTSLAATIAGGLITGISPLDANVAALRGGGFAYWDASPANIAWWSVPARWLTPNGWVPYLDLAWLGRALALAGTALLVGLAFAAGRRFRASDAFLTALPLMVLAGPISWDHYLILALPWLALAFRRAATADRRTQAAFAILGVVLVLGIPAFVTPLDRVGWLEVATLFQFPTLGLIAAAVLASRGWIAGDQAAAAMRLENSNASA